MGSQPSTRRREPVYVPVDEVQAGEGAVASAMGERLARIEEQLRALPRLEKLIQDALRGFKSQADALEAAVQSRALHCVVQTSKVTSLENSVQKVEKDLEAVKSLMPVVKGVLWVAGVLGATVIVFIWSLIVGQVQVVFP